MRNTKPLTGRCDNAHPVVVCLDLVRHQATEGDPRHLLDINSAPVLRDGGRESPSTEVVHDGIRSQGRFVGEKVPVRVVGKEDLVECNSASA